MENSENTTEKILYPDIAEEIERMVIADQGMREKSLHDDDSWEEEVDLNNTARMKEIVAEIGWPTITKVGKEGSFNAWLLVQHADLDPAFQRACLNLMKDESEEEVSRVNIAMLEDRVLLAETGIQLYGTQYMQEGEKHIPLPIKDAESVDERRKEMGLDTLEENIARMYQKYPFKKEK